MSTPAPAFDARPLTDPVDPAAARAFGRELRASGRAPSAFGTSAILLIVFAAVFLFVFVSIAVTLVSGVVAMVASGGAGASLVGMVTILAIAGCSRPSWSSSCAGSAGLRCSGTASTGSPAPTA